MKPTPRKDYLLKCRGDLGLRLESALTEVGKLETELAAEKSAQTAATWALGKCIAERDRLREALQDCLGQFYHFVNASPKLWDVTSSELQEQFMPWVKARSNAMLTVYAELSKQEETK